MGGAQMLTPSALYFCRWARVGRSLGTLASSRNTACVPNSGSLFDPVEHIGIVEGLGEDLPRRNAGLLVFVDQLLCIRFLAAKHLLDLQFGVTVGSFEFGRKLGAERVDKLDAFLVAQQRPPCCIQIRAPVREFPQILVRQ